MIDILFVTYIFRSKQPATNAYQNEDSPTVFNFNDHMRIMGGKASVPHSWPWQVKGSDLTQFRKLNLYSCLNTYNRVIHLNMFGNSSSKWSPTITRVANFCFAEIV